MLAHGLGSTFCIRQKAGTQKLISEGLTKEPRTRSELKYGEGRRGGGWRAVDEKPHQKTHLLTTMGHLLKTNIDNNATQRVRETEEHDNRRTYDCIEKNNGSRKIMTVKYRLSHNYRLIVPVLER